MPGDPYWSNVVFLSGFEGGTVVDESPLGQTVTTYGTTAATSSQAKFGTQSLAMPASGDTGISVPDHAAFTLGTSPFTIEGWFRVSTNTNEQRGLAAHSDLNGNRAWEIMYRHDTDEMNFFYANLGANNTIGGAGIVTFVLDTWYHVAADFDGTTYRLYRDGVVIGSDTYSLSILDPSVPLRIGAADASPGQGLQFHNGFVDEWRITVGVARYAAAGGFAPPVAAFERGPTLPETSFSTITDRVVMDSGAVHALTGGADLALGYVLDYPALSLAAAETVLRLPVASDGIGITLIPEGVRATPAVAVDTVQVASVLLVYFGQVISETIGSADVLAPTMKSGAILAETLGVAELLQSASPASLTDNIGVASVLTMVQGAVLADILGVSEAVLGSQIARVIQTEGVQFSDALLKFLSGDVAEGVGVAQSDTALLLASGVLGDGISISSAVTPMFLLRITAEDTIGIDPGEALQMLFNPTVVEGVEISAAYLSPGGGITTWAMNTQTAAVTEYSGYDFNSFAKVGPHYVGASSSGIYTLDGDTDAGTDIISRIKSGFAQFSGSRFTSFKAAYLGVRGEGNFILRVVDGEGKSYDYAVSTRNTRSTKVHMGKGLRARYFSFELISTGQDFDLDTVEFVPITENRRV